MLAWSKQFVLNLGPALDLIYNSSCDVRRGQLDFRLLYSLVFTCAVCKPMSSSSPNLYQRKIVAIKADFPFTMFTLCLLFNLIPGVSIETTVLISFSQNTYNISPQN